jgi:hypothetical protein
MVGTMSVEAILLGLLPQPVPGQVTETQSEETNTSKKGKTAKLVPKVVIGPMPARVIKPKKNMQLVKP